MPPDNMTEWQCELVKLAASAFTMRIRIYGKYIIEENNVRLSCLPACFFFTQVADQDGLLRTATFLIMPARPNSSTLRLRQYYLGDNGKICSHVQLTTDCIKEIVDYLQAFVTPETGKHLEYQGLVEQKLRV